MKLEIDEREILAVQKTNVQMGTSAGTFRVTIEPFNIDKREATVYGHFDAYIIILKSKTDLINNP